MIRYSSYVKLLIIILNTQLICLLNNFIAYINHVKLEQKYDEFSTLFAIVDMSLMV